MTAHLGFESFSVRLHPGDDPLAALDRLAAEHGWEAACVVSVVGSLKQAVVRFANRSQPETLAGPFEIVSFTGVFSVHGTHAHIGVADSAGRALGGHLMPGSEVFTTAEIVLAVLPGLRFERSHDPETGYPELAISRITGGAA